MGRITITSYVQLAALLAFAVIFFVRVGATARDGINPFAFLLSKERRGKLVETGFLLVTLLFFVEVGLQAFNRPFRLLPDWAYVPLLYSRALYAAGVVLVLTSFIVLVRAYVDLGPSWRVGVDPHQPSDLVTSGIYGWTRNPIYFFFMLYTLGTLFMFPSPVFLVLTLAMWLMVIAMTRQEEIFLHAAFGATYDDYRSRTPRFIPLLRRPAEAVSAVPRRTAERELSSQKTLGGWLRSLCALPPAGRGVSEVILWWERRRLYYNVIVAAGCFLFLLFSTIAAYVESPARAANVSAVRGFFAILLIVMSNLWYTGGWIAELLLRLVVGDRMLWFAPVMFAVGILFSFLFSSLFLI
jgi:protein-S-isoprenylcysteine O-methyltransferase Ste14